MMEEKDVEQAMYTIEQLKQQVENMNRQRQMIMISLEEHMRARLTLGENSKETSDHEILVPLGANTFMYAKTTNNEKVLIGIGADVVIEDTVPSAMEKLDTTIKLLEDTDKRIATRITDMENQIIELNSGVEQAVVQAEKKHHHNN